MPRISGGPDGIFPESFIKIPNPEKQQRIRVFGLDGIILAHQRGISNFILRGFTIFFWKIKSMHPAGNNLLLVNKRGKKFRMTV